MWTWTSVLACVVFVVIFESQETWGDKLFTTALMIGFSLIVFY